MPRFPVDKFTPVDLELRCHRKHDKETLERTSAIRRRVDLELSPGPKKISGGGL